MGLWLPVDSEYVLKISLSSPSPSLSPLHSLSPFSQSLLSLLSPLSLCLCLSVSLSVCYTHTHTHTHTHPQCWSRPSGLNRSICCDGEKREAIITMLIGTTRWKFPSCPGLPPTALPHTLSFTVGWSYRCLDVTSGWCLEAVGVCHFQTSTQTVVQVTLAPAFGKLKDLIQAPCVYVPGTVGNSKNGTKWMKPLPLQSFFSDRQTNAPIH